MKTILISGLLLILPTVITRADKLVFAYDSTGNRISRSIELSSKKPTHENAALSGATPGNSAMTIGHYSLGPNNYVASWTDNLFVHEYGHYIQTQQMGFFYFPVVALPSIASAAFTSRWSGMKHRERWFEVDASNKGAEYFDKHYGSGKKGYTKGNPNYFDINTFRLNRFSPYVNKRTGSNRQDHIFPVTTGKISFWDFIL